MNLDKPIAMTLSELQLLAATRVILGLGIGLLVAERLSGRRRSALGRTLTMVGIASTIPLAANVLGKLGVFSKQSEDTSSIRQLGRKRQWAEQSTGVW